MTIREDDVRRSARELRTILVGLGGTHEPALVEKSLVRVPPTTDALRAADLASHLVRVEAELEATRSRLAASLQREARLRAPNAKTRLNFFS